MHPLAATLLFALALAGSVVPVRGQDASLERHITVVGEGAANVVPDLAVIQGGVTTQGKTAREASEANSAAMTSVLAAIKANGIAERDAQTSQFSISPVYDPRREGDSRIIGFQATNQISVRVRALARIATVLDQIIAAGANQISGIDFTVSERSRLLDNARTQAVADARRKADQLARAAGVRLGRATVIVENAGPLPVERMPMRRTAAAASVPVAVGEQTLQVYVTMSFELVH